MTHRSHRMQKYKFSITFPDALFVQSIRVPPKHDKLCIDDLGPGHIGVHYVTDRSDQMQKHKFNLMWPRALFVQSIPVPPEHDK
jgi:hypothetical protein